MLRAVIVRRAETDRFFQPNQFHIGEILPHHVRGSVTGSIVHDDDFDRLGNVLLPKGFQAGF